MKPVKVGLLGLGVVGNGTREVLARNREEISRRAGRDIVVKSEAHQDQQLCAQARSSKQR